MKQPKEIIPKTKSKFLRAKCNSCGNEQVVFSAPATVVKCLVCEGIFARPSGSKAELNAKEITAL
ncbi:MAG: 30S ribosomal protein S27e [Candidatus Diapherotrites archaeon]|nr:30S ribosomal protein S27e [Candidatus Diapherotrites archaeon]